MHIHANALNDGAHEWHGLLSMRIDGSQLKLSELHIAKIFFPISNTNQLQVYSVAVSLYLE